MNHSDNWAVNAAVIIRDRARGNVHFVSALVAAQAAADAIAADLAALSPEEQVQHMRHIGGWTANIERAFNNAIGTRKIPGSFNTEYPLRAAFDLADVQRIRNQALFSAGF